MKRKPNKSRSPMKQELFKPNYRRQVVKSKKTYDRKTNARTRHPGDYFCAA